ncbi:ribosomal protein L11 methyltransferase [Lachnospiraceae bacterium RM5]|nr:ribosomal protein L11 methyltransferase [Lachnospiraceae bacterium RM5]
MKWYKLVLDIKEKDVDIISGMLVDIGICDFQVEDNISLSDEEKEKLFVDMTPDVEKKDTAKIIFYREYDTSPLVLASEIERIREGLEDYKELIDTDKVLISKEVVDDENWINNWKEFFKPFIIEGILIKPSWEDVSDMEGYDHILEIDPETAFGTGRHETTSLCIKGLKKYLKKDDTLIDVGCGSGILAIIGKLLGSKNTAGIDIDEKAVEISRENFKKNLEINKDIDDNIEFYAGDILTNTRLRDRIIRKTGEADVVVANIFANIIEELQKDVHLMLKPGGIFISSGIINTKEDEVKSFIMENKNLEIVEIARDGEWVSIVAKRIED